MADWDEDSARLRSNLTQVLRDVRDGAVRRDSPTAEAARKWQADTMAWLEVSEVNYVGRFRGEPGLENARVWIDTKEAMAPAQVASELAAFAPGPMPSGFASIRSSTATAGLRDLRWEARRV